MFGMYLLSKRQTPGHFRNDRDPLACIATSDDSVFGTDNPLIYVQQHFSVIRLSCKIA